MKRRQREAIPDDYSHRSCLYRIGRGLQTYAQLPIRLDENTILTAESLVWHSTYEYIDEIHCIPLLYTLAWK